MAGIKDRSFEIIDAHTHVIEHLSGFGNRGELRALGNGKARWATGEEVTMLAEGYGDKSFTYDRLIQEMDAHGISKAIMMQGSYLGFCNDYTHEAQEKYPDRLFGMGTFDPYCLEYPKIMKNLIKKFKFRGFKFEISTLYGLMGTHIDLKIDGKIMRPVWEYAQNEKLNISFDLGTFHEPSFQIDGLANVAKEYREVNFVVEHIFFPHLNHFDDAKRALDKLALYENIIFTTASIPISTLPEKYPFPSACRYLEIAKEMVGADRIMWGSDLPTVCVNLPLTELINYIFESGVFNQEELEKVYSKNASEVYKL